MAASFEQIFAVADELEATGQKPTLAAVRRALGGGSYTTISEAMAQWRAQRTARAVAPMRDPAPAVVAERLGELGAEIWATALGLANDRLAADRQALEELRTKLEAQQQETAELADQLAAELEDARNQVSATQAALDSAREDGERLRAQLGASQERGATAEARAAELRTELDQAHRERGELRAELRAAQQAAKAEHDALHAERDAAAARADALHAELAAVKAKMEVEQEAHQEQRRRAAQETARLVDRYTKTQGERDAVQKEAAQARDEATRAREEAAMLRGRLQALESMNGGKPPAPRAPKGGEDDQR